MELKASALAVILAWGLTQFSLWEGQISIPYLCQRIDSKLPPIYLSIDPMAQDKEETRMILKNNLTCAIKIRTTGFQVIQSPNGGLKISRADELEDNATAAVQYQVFDNTTSVVHRLPTYEWDHSVFLPRLGAGKSVYFRVKNTYLDSKYQISVSYEHDWYTHKEREIGIEHRVYFLRRLIERIR